MLLVPAPYRTMTNSLALSRFASCFASMDRDRRALGVDLYLDPTLEP